MDASCREIGTADSETGRRVPHPLRRLARGFLWLLNLFLGCGHHQTTFPFTPVRRNGAAGAPRSGTYVVCLGCGKTFEYDWKEMRMGPPVAAPTRKNRIETPMPRPIPACPRFDWNEIRMERPITVRQRIDPRPRRARA